MTDDADVFEARWKGTIELDPETLDATTLDGIVFAVVAFRVEEMGATKINKDGRKRRKDIFHVEDARVVLGDLREQAVQYLAGGPMELDDAEGVVRAIESAKRLVRREVFDDPTFPADDSEPEGVVMHALDYKKTAQAESSGRDGPKVAKFIAEDIPAAPSGGGDVEQVGSIRPEGYRSKDKVLQRFLES